VYARLGLWEQAEVLQRRLVDLRRRVSGPRSDRLAVTLEAHAVSLANLGRHDESAARFAAALAIFEESLDPGHWRIANSLRNVGRLLDLGGRPADALGHFDRAVRITEAAGRRTAHLRGQRALALWSLGRHAQARTEFEDVVAEIEAASGEYGRAALSDALFWLGMAQIGAGDRAAAVDALRRTLTSRRALHGDGHPRTDEALCALALAEETVGTGSLSAALERYRRWGLADPRLLAMLEGSIR
jgi:tetratricopeptide (TPR) repeat protein